MTALHVLAGGLALVLGAIALSAAKGRWLHRKSGLLFVGAMLAMSLLGASIAAEHANTWSAVNIPAGLLTAYLVATGLTTMRPAPRWLDAGLMLMALALGMTTLVFTLQAFAAGGTRNGVPAFAFLMFTAIGLSGGLGDLRIMRSGRLRGAPRLARHLWRMCLGLWIATASFFLGPRARVAKVLPEALVKPGLLALPVLLVLATMVFWLWRVRARRTIGTIGALS